jgi:zinc transporter ZupT
MVIIAGLILLIPTTVGYLFGFGPLKHLLKRRTHTVLGFALGVYCVIAYSLIVESLEHATLVAVLCGIAATICCMEILSRIVDAHHHHHGEDDHVHTKSDGRSILISDGIHNMTDGLVLVPAFSISPLIGFATTLSIFIHELILETAKYFILREAGYTAQQAITRGTAVGATVFLGIGMAYYISSVDLIAPWLTIIATGSVLYAIMRDLIPDVLFHHVHTEKRWEIGTAFICGFLLLLAVQTVLPHTE